MFDENSNWAQIEFTIPTLTFTENHGNADEFLENTYFVICWFHFLSKVVPDLAGDLFRLICAVLPSCLVSLSMDEKGKENNKTPCEMELTIPRNS